MNMVGLTSGSNEETKIHHAVSRDGTGIAGRFHGQGPPLVLLPAGPGDSRLCWQYVLPYLSKQFTCYLMDTRGRGLSAEHHDHSRESLVQDIIAFAESIGQPVGLVELGDCLWSLAAAQSNPAIASVAAYDPGVDEAMSGEDARRLMEVVERVAQAVEKDRLEEAARIVIEGIPIYTPEELAEGTPLNFWMEASSNIPLFLREQQAGEPEGHDLTDPSILTRIKIPVLLMNGARSHPFFRDSVDYLARHLADSRVAMVAEAGHFGPHTRPEAIAKELNRFFAEVFEAGDNDRISG